MDSRNTARDTKDVRAVFLLSSPLCHNNRHFESTPGGRIGERGMKSGSLMVFITGGRYMLGRLMMLNGVLAILVFAASPGVEAYDVASADYDMIDFTGYKVEGPMTTEFLTSTSARATPRFCLNFL